MLVEEMSAETGLCKGLKPKAVRHRGFSAEHESRILRVSRLTGGKDRHSKVWTYKGARDRRVRLSVPTAIKFYDLQDRLRFEQPSMVIDWLINEAKAAIDELPALPPELPSVSQITSSNGSPIKAEGSSVTATATAGTGPGPGPAPGPPMLSAEAAAAVQDEQSKTQSPRKPQDGHLSCSPAQELDLGRSTSSTSDGSIKGEYRFPSKSAAIIRAKKREHARERTKNKPKASRKSPQRQHHHKLLNENMFKPLSVTEQWRGTSSPLPILRTATAHNFYGNGGMPSNNTLQQLLDDTVTLPSYSDMLCTQDSTTNPMHHMDSTSNTGITRSQPPSNNISVIGGTTTSTAALQCYELELAVSCLDQKQHRIAEENNSTMSQIQTSIPIFDLMRTMENPSPQLPISHLEMHFSSGLMPNNELNNLWSLSSRGPLQSNIVAAHMTAGLPHKNTYEDYSSGYSQVFRLQ